ncbi:MAG TPA: proton-conducting transporter membrane subunit, partial [Candidatus Binatia bacterium]|nr:proton-conducting transporter membrane subunit [Candidatus Binatia bacterium]
MNPQNLLIPILLPLLLALFSFLLPQRVKWLREIVSVLGAALFAYVTFALFGQKELFFILPWLGHGIDFELRLYQFSQFILLALGGVVFLITLYSTARMADHPRRREYYGYLFLTAAMAAGALLANNFVPLVFFWEGLLITLYALINLGGKNAHRTAVKSFIIGGFCDFAMILGIAILWTQTGTLRMSDLAVVPEGLTAVSFFLMLIGAMGKAGAMPFHTWIPDAAIDAPVSVMAFIPGALEKLLGIYLLVRIALDFYKLEVNSPFSITMMVIGAATIVLAVFMALIQKDLKRLLSYHPVSQVGYMILGI